MSTEPNGGVQDEETVQNVNSKRLALDRALTNVVNMARRLNFSCAEGYKSLEESLEMAIPTDLKPIEDTASSSPVKTGSGKPCPKRKPNTPVRYTPKGSKFPKTESIPKTPRGVQCLTAHLPVPPPPPPPSPRCPQARELCLAATPLVLRTILIISMGGGGSQSEGGAAFPTAASVLALTGN